MRAPAALRGRRDRMQGEGAKSWLEKGIHLGLPTRAILSSVYADPDRR